MYEVVFANGFFLASANAEYHPSGTVYYQKIRFFASTNGTNWSQGAFTDDYYIPNYFRHRFLVFANGLFYEATGEVNPPHSINRVPLTPDGSTSWLSYAPTETSDFSSMTYGNGRYLLNGLDGRIWSSTTGTNWSQAYGGCPIKHVLMISSVSTQY